MPVLMRAAESAGYMWEPTGAVQALLLYAKTVGLAGDSAHDAKDHRPGDLEEHNTRDCRSASRSHERGCGRAG